MFFKKTAIPVWQDLFLFVLDSFSSLNKETLQEISPLALAVALYVTYSFGKPKTMRELYGNAFLSENAEQNNPAVQFLTDINLYDFRTMNTFFYCPCCSPWKLGLGKEAKKRIKKATAHNAALRTQWELFSEQVKKNCFKCQRRFDTIQNPE